MIAVVDEGVRRVAAEVDRAARYRRPVTVALLRIPRDACAIAERMRAMDLLAAYDDDVYLAILPELGRTDGLAAIARMEGVERRAVAVCPEDGTTPDAIFGVLRGEHAPPPRAAPQAVFFDPAMLQLDRMIERVADSSMTILVLGETGTGKEVVAEALHERSSRRDEPFVKVACGAPPERWFELAGRGTLFLDELHELPVPTQVQLLRVLERKEGALAARVIAATHRDLDAEVRAGRFRADLLFRVGGFTLTVPPLRDRPTEILPLADHFIRRGSFDRKPPGLTPDARDLLTGYTWPGNVRELRNAIERAMVLADGEITPADLPERLNDAASQNYPSSTNVRGRLAEIERSAIVTALQKENNNQTRAARRLGLSRRALIYKLEKYGLKVPAPRGR